MGNEFKAPFPDKKNPGKNLQSKGVVKQVICPLDGSPCEMDCPDRYRDRPDGGCQLTVAVELGGQVFDFGGGIVGMLFRPKGGDDR